MPRGIPKNKQPDAGQQDTQQQPQTRGRTVSKTEAVKRALDRLGPDAKPLDIQEHIKKRFGLVLPTSLISNYKFTLAKREGGQSRLIPRAKAETPEPAATGGSAAEITLEDIRAVKALADKIGAEKVRALAQVLGK
jgi:hypothetical protein